MEPDTPRPLSAIEDDPCATIRELQTVADLLDRQLRERDAENMRELRAAMLRYEIRIMRCRLRGGR